VPKGKSIIGIGMRAAGIVGLIYALPIISNAVAAKGLVFKESDVPVTPNTIGPYVAIIIASAGLLVSGVFLSIIGQESTEKSSELPKQDAEKNASEQKNKDTSAA
jgi:hypothetical protein